MHKIYINFEKCIHLSYHTTRCHIKAVKNMRKINISSNIYLFKVKNRNTRKRCEIRLKLTMKTIERRLKLTIKSPEQRQ